MKSFKVVKIHRRDYSNDWKASIIIHKSQLGQVCSKCGFSGSKFNPVERHHIIPLSKGGPDTLENLKLLCKSCHETHHRRGRL